MTSPSDSKRIDSVTRVILASPRSLYRAHLNREMMANWRTPTGMQAEILDFDGRLGGGYRMALHYLDPTQADQGNRFSGRFEELVPDEKIVERIAFETDDPALWQPMTMTTTLRAVRDGTKVTVKCTPLPAAISATDHIESITSSLRRLALLTE